MQVTSSTAIAVPLPLKGKDNAPLMMRLDRDCRAFTAIADLIHRYRGPPSAQGTASHVLQGEGLNAAPRGERAFLMQFIAGTISRLERYNL